MLRPTRPFGLNCHGCLLVADFSFWPVNFGPYQGALSACSSSGLPSLQSTQVVASEKPLFCFEKDLEPEPEVFPAGPSLSSRFFRLITVATLELGQTPFLGHQENEKSNGPPID